MGTFRLDISEHKQYKIAMSLIELLPGKAEAVALIAVLSLIFCIEIYNGIKALISKK